VSLHICRQLTAKIRHRSIRNVYDATAGAFRQIQAALAAN
jgi:hypothetical protein